MRRARRPDLRQAEVEDLRLPPGVDENVGGLQVPVHDPLPVGGLERVGDLDGQVEQGSEPQGSRADHPAERLPLEQLHHDEVLRFVFFDRVHRADVRVIECRRRPRLALEALESRSVLGELGRQELQRHAPPEPRVLGLVDDTHPAGAELRRHAIVRDCSPDHSSVFLLSGPRMLSARRRGRQRRNAGGNVRSREADSRRRAQPNAVE